MHKTSDLKEIKLFLKKGLDLERKDHDGNTPLLFQAKPRKGKSREMTISAFNIVPFIKIGANVCARNNKDQNLKFLISNYKIFQKDELSPYLEKISN